MSNLDAQEAPLKSPIAPPPEHKSGTGLLVGAILRVLLFATSVAAIIVMVTSEQTKTIPLAPGFSLRRAAKFNHSPAFIYFVVALSVACLHSIVTGVMTISGLKRGGISAKLQFRFVMFDALLLGIVAAATGAAGGVAYIGLKGNSHTQWNKICNIYGSFCFHFAASILLSLISSITLLLLIWLARFVLSKKIARR